MPTTPPTITSAPTPGPQRGEKATFSSRMDAFVTWISAAVAQFGVAATNAYSNAVDAFNSATNAAASATSAAGSASAAALASGVTIWVSGTTYAIGDCRFSPINSGTYRRKTAGAGTTDPSADGTNWALISYAAFPYLKVSQRLATSTNGGTNVAADITQTRALNTTETNTITGASLASNVVTLPAGTYLYRARVPAYGVSAHQAFLYNTSDAAYTGIGSPALSTVTGSTHATDSWISGQFTIASSKNFTLRHYTASVATTYGMGFAAGVSGQIEVFSELEFTKVA